MADVHNEIIKEAEEELRKEEAGKGKRAEKAEKAKKEKPAFKPEMREKEKKKEEKKAKKPARKVDKVEGFNPWKVLKYPHLAEKSMNMVETENKLVFIVDRRASKERIKEAIEKGFGAAVIDLNTEITTKGEKKAYAKLSPESDASDIASRLGMI